MALPPYKTPLQRAWHYSFRGICGLIFVFLIAPLLIVAPLSFNVEPYFSFTPGMLALESEAFSTRWYENIVTLGMTNPEASWADGWLADMWHNAQWIRAIKNSFYIGIVSALIATALGTLAALGLSKPEMPFRAAITGFLISPMIVPIIVTATGMYFFYASIGIAKSYAGVIVAHATLGVPFVVITVTATLSGFDHNLTRAALSLGATPWTAFRKVIMPLIMPGMISGGLFAFVTSFDDVVAMLFLGDIEQRTVPRQMWSGIREQISPTILAVATILVLFSIALLTVAELLRRRSERLQGIAK